MKSVHYAPFVGMLRILKALFLRADGVDEGYGDGKQPHVFGFPWVVEKSIKDAGLKIIKVDHPSYQTSIYWCRHIFFVLGPFLV